MNRSVAALIPFGFLGLFASSAWAQACIPVVFAFRHAEDTSYRQLTPTGNAHAELYTTMVENFEATDLEPGKKPCRVTRVYSVTIDDKPSGAQNATNSFNTAKPLAEARMGTVPITAVTDSKTRERKLFEYVGTGEGDNAPADPTTTELYSNSTATALRTALLARANSGQSSAIFWTSQGLQVLGGAIIGRFSQVPKKNLGTLPPRNAVYLFKAIGEVPNITGFEDTPTTPKTTSHPARYTSTVYVQCFNWLNATTQPEIKRDENQFIAPDSSGQLYYCGYDEQSSPGGMPPEGQDCKVDDPNAKTCGLIRNDRNQYLKGKICDTRKPLENTGGAGVFGACR